MAKARALDKRRKSIRNIKKITRTMELIATAKYRKAMDRAIAATSFTRRITQLVRDLAVAGLKVSHPLLEPREQVKQAKLLVLTSNRGLCGGYNGAVFRQGVARWEELNAIPGVEKVGLAVSGKRGIAALKYRKVPIDDRYTQFEDQPKYDEVEALANQYLEDYTLGKLDRLDVAYTRFVSSSKQIAVAETLLPLASVTDEEAGVKAGEAKQGTVDYEFLPSAASILEEVVPASFKVKLFKCFLDAAVSEQIARMVAMKSATENAQDMIRSLSRTYNRARQSQITNEILEVIGGAEALSG